MVRGWYYTPSPFILVGTLLLSAYVLLDENYKKIDTFSSYVRPSYATKISSHVHNLTGISTDDVMNAPSLNEALFELVSWIGEGFKTRIYSWSDTDLRQLKNECTLKEISFPKCMNRWVDLQLIYGHMIGFPQKLSLKNAIMSIDGEFSSTSAHSALYDALATSELLVLTTYKEEFSKRTQSIRELFIPKKSACTIGDLCRIELAQFAI